MASSGPYEILRIVVRMGVFQTATCGVVGVVLAHTKCMGVYFLWELLGVSFTYVRSQLFT
jgi:hypothetical protein